MSQPLLDQSNAEFWAELCGSSMARAAGITGQGPDDLRRFDELYFDYYPYLERYLPSDFAGDQVLEIGLGYGTLGQSIASRGAEYHGVDISLGPVAMMRKRLEWLGQPQERVLQASALELPHADETFDHVYSIGCLHHTGDLQRSVDEVHRVLRPGGRAVVMLYNDRSFRRVAFSVLGTVMPKYRAGEEDMRAMYDADESGTPAPYTEFVSKAGAKRLFRAFDRVRIEKQNFDGFRWGIEREWFLGNAARVAGLDLYIVAAK
jgi:SAM-dependent methyltransferase